MISTKVAAMNVWSLEATDVDVSFCYDLKDTRQYTIGRKRGYDIVSSNPLVSRNHGIITIRPNGELYIKDLKSANGTYINDRAITPLTDYKLHKDDLLGIGAPSTATEPKKEMYWVRYKPSHVEVVQLTEADSTSNEELVEQDIADNLDSAITLSNSNVKVTNINKDVVASEDEIFPENVKETKDNNSDNRIIDKNDLCKQTEKIIKLTDELPSSSTHLTVNYDSTNISNIKKSFQEESKVVNSDSKNKIGCEDVEEPRKSNSVNSVACLSNVSQNKTSEELKLNAENIKSVHEKNKDCISKIFICSSSDEEENSKNDISSDKNPRLKAESLKSLHEKRKDSISKIFICSSSDEEENSKNDKSSDKNPSTSDKKTNDNYGSDDNMERVKIKQEPKNHSFTQNDDDYIVIVSDDDDEIFPKSQIFGDDVKVKDEPIDNVNVSPVSDNNENNHDNMYRETVKNEIPDYDYNDNENEEDASDDDCILWYHKLSQSQDFISSSQKKKLETPKEVEQDDFFKFDGIDDVDFEKPLDEELRESRISPVASDTNDEDVQLKTKEVEETNDAIDSRPTDKISSISSSSKLLSTDEKEEDKSSKRKYDPKKSYVKPPVIDAPFLKKGKRKAHEEKETKIKEISSSKPKRRKSIHEDTPSVPVSVKTAVQSSGLNIDKSVKDELDKRHKNKKRRQSIETFTKNEKQKIQEDRKKKLKELASKIIETKEKKDEVQKSHHTKPKVKVSTGRGVFLTGEDPKQVPEKKKKSEAPLEEENKKKFKIPRRSSSVSSEPSTSKSRTTSELNTLSKPNSVNKEKELVEPSKSDRKEPSVKKKNKLSFNHLEQDPVEKPRRLSIASNSNVTSNGSKSTGILLAQDNNRNSEKRVRFREEPEIRYIERIPGNICRKVDSKDAPVPAMATNVRDSVNEDDQILSIILGWRPEWLEEQKGFKDSPQVSRRKPLRMLTNYNTFRDYYDIITPLMLLELWRQVFRDWMYNSSPVYLACVENISTHPDGLYVNCYCLAERDTDNYFRNGDLLVVELHILDKKFNGTTKKFAEVVNVNKRRMGPTDNVHKQLIGGMPQFKIYVTIFLKKIQLEIVEEKLMRLRLVSRIAPQLRIFKSVLNLSKSPLCHFILKPTSQQYKIAKATQMISSIEDKLNHNQFMCIFEAYQICTRKEPGIYLIQGPPGTGKSYVIKNLIRQLLADSTKNKNLPKCRILLCAPSNGAIDELANSLLDMRSKMCKTDRFKMIRLGPPTSIINAKVKSISVQTLVENHLAAQQDNKIKTNSFMNEEYNFLLKKKDTINNTIMNMEASNVNYSLEVQKLRKVQESLERLKSNAKTYQEKKKAERDTEILILEGAQIICSTLTSCIGSKLEELVAEKKIEFTCCIIDEATQSGEPETLIPLLLGINRLVLVGDPEQLPPTTLSQEAKELGHGNSLFSRIQNCLEYLPDNPIRMLTDQYRMHPQICKFPSQHFYGGRLKTAEIIASRTEKILDPCRLFCLNSNIDYKENEYLNKTEANLVLLLTDIVIRKTKYNVGIITPYTKQKDYLVSKYCTMRAKEKEDEERYPPRVVINTVDGFQGQERDVIIISSVRYKSNIFLNDLQRLNVALTRAKHALFICAHAHLFKTESIWQKLEADAKSRSFFYSLTEKDATDERYMSELIIRH